jgi:hypothetical protein
MENNDVPENPPTDVPVGSPFLTAGESMHCTRLLYLLSDAEGRTWLGVGPSEDVHPGGVMAHLLPGQDVRVVSSNAESLIVRVPRQTVDQLDSEDPDDELFAGFDMDVPAYPLASALVPSFSTSAPAADPADTAL